jgi:erythromycin esterase
VIDRRRLLLNGASLIAATMAGAALDHGARAEAVRSQVAEEVVAWLKANVLPLASVEPGSPFHDLAPLHAMLSKARIVSLGEATHGTREFFKLKHRLIEYCVTELGFTIIGFEASYGQTLPVNDYVLNGKGSAADVVAGMGFWTWNTEEVAALVEWVRAWNRTNERKVKFYGFDMQDGPSELLYLLAYLERVAPELAAESERSLAPYASPYTSDFSFLSAAVQETISAQVKTVLRAFAAQRTHWVDQEGEHEWHLARLSAIVLEQAVRDSIENTKGYTFRDLCMANNVRALLDAEGPGAKAVLWAHNAHVQRLPLFGSTMMGSVLREAYGAESVNVGFAFNRGSFQALTHPNGGLRSQVVGPAPDGYVDAVLALTGIPLLALDLTRVPPDGAVASWMASNPKQRSIGAGFSPEIEHDGDVAGDPHANFDVLLFVESTTAARRQKRGGSSGMPVVPLLVTESNEKPTNLALAGDATPHGWVQTDFSDNPFVVALSDDASPSGRRAVRFARADTLFSWGVGALTQSFPAAPWRGRRLIFSAAMRAEAARIGTGAQLAVMVWPKQCAEGAAARAILALQPDGMVRSSRWMRRSVAVDIPADAERLQVILVATGNGVHWFSDLDLEAPGLAHDGNTHFTPRLVRPVPATNLLSRSLPLLDR